MHKSIQRILDKRPLNPHANSYIARFANGRTIERRNTFKTFGVAWLVEGRTTHIWNDGPRTHSWKLSGWTDTRAEAEEEVRRRVHQNTPVWRGSCDITFSDVIPAELVVDLEDA